jgi:transposase
LRRSSHGTVAGSLGHEVRLMSPEYARPYVKAQKNDDHDTEAIAEAATRPTMRFVELRSEEQRDVQTLHRVRDRLVGERTSLTNQIRSLLLERGHVVAQGHARLRHLLGDMRTRWDELDRRIAACDAEFAAMARPDERARRLTGIPGMGALNATALVAAVGNAATFKKGRDLARLAGSGAQAGGSGGQAEAAGDFKAGQSLPAQDADPGRAIRHANIGEGEFCCRCLAACAACAHPSQRRCCRPRREDGPHRLGASAARAELRTRAAGGRLRNTRLS